MKLVDITEQTSSFILVFIISDNCIFFGERCVGFSVGSFIAQVSIRFPTTEIYFFSLEVHIIIYMVKNISNVGKNKY